MKSRPKITLKKLFILFGLTVSLFLLTANIYGLFFSLRPAQPIDSQYLRFHNDVTLTYEQGLEMLTPRQDDNSLVFAKRVNQAISGSLAHIHWGRYEPEKFNQTIPVWENYFLYFMGKLSGMKNFERYHFTDYRRSLYRGIGICGDASMIMSQVLDKNNIENKIISVPGHVVVEARVNNDLFYSFDPDFGVVMPYSIEQINKKPDIVAAHYYKQGYSEKEVNNLVDRYGRKVKIWDGVNHFVTKKYYFERVTYWLKWPLPIITLLIFTAWLFKETRRQV